MSFVKIPAFCVNSDKNLTIEKIMEIRRRPSCCSYSVAYTTHSNTTYPDLCHWDKNFVREINFCTLVTFTMRGALYVKKFKKTWNKRKLARLIKNTIFNLFFAQLSIRFNSRYNVTLSLSISMIFLHSSVIAYSSSDNNSTCLDLMVAKKMLIQITFQTN